MDGPAVETPPPEAPAEPRPSSRPLAGLLRVSSLTVVSRVLGLIRDAAMAAAFGNGPVLDAFSVAFRLPNVTRRLFGEAAFSTAFLPVFVRELHTSGKDAAWTLATAILVVTAAAVSAVTVVAEVVLLGCWSLSKSDETRLLLGLTAALFPYQIFVCLAAQAAAVLHAFGRFTLAALLPTIGNAVWLGALAVALGSIESAEKRMYAVSFGVVAAGAAQFAFTIPALARLGFVVRWDWPAARSRVREVAFAVLPLLAGLSVTELNSLADGLFAWLLTAPAGTANPNPLRYPLEPGTAAALYLGQRLYQFPLGVFGVALGTVLFPRFARHAAVGRRDELRGDLTLGLKLSLAIGLPASAGLIVVARPMADALFRYGAFDAADARQTAATVSGYAVGVWAFISLLIANRGFYAVGDRITPLKAGLAATALNLVLNVSLAWPLGGFGLAIGTALASSFQVALLVFALRGRDLSPDLRGLGVTALKAAGATAVMAAAALALRDGIAWGDDAAGRVVGLVVPACGGLAAYFAAATMLGLRELRLLLPRRG